MGKKRKEKSKVGKKLKNEGKLEKKLKNTKKKREEKTLWITVVIHIDSLTPFRYCYNYNIYLGYALT